MDIPGQPTVLGVLKCIELNQYDHSYIAAGNMMSTRLDLLLDHQGCTPSIPIPNPWDFVAVTDLGKSIQMSLECFLPLHSITTGID